MCRELGRQVGEYLDSVSLVHGEGGAHARTLHLHRLAVDDLAGGEQGVEHEANLAAVVQHDVVHLALDLHPAAAVSPQPRRAKVAISSDISHQ